MAIVEGFSLERPFFPFLAWEKIASRRGPACQGVENRGSLNSVPLALRECTVSLLERQFTTLHLFHTCKVVNASSAYSIPKKARNPDLSKIIHAQYDWTTGVPDNGNEWRKFRAVPCSYPLRSLVFYIV